MRIASGGLERAIAGLEPLLEDCAVGQAQLDGARLRICFDSQRGAGPRQPRAIPQRKAGARQRRRACTRTTRSPP